MLTWALVNFVLTGLALLFALANKGAPHRLRFHVCFMAMLAWLVPWSQLPAWMPDLLSLDLWRVEQKLIASSAAATTLPLIIVDTRSLPLANELTVLHLPLLVLAGLLLTGLALFVWQLGTHHIRLRRLRKTAQDGSDLWRHTGIASAVPILLQTEINGAFSSGMLRPEIWVHRELTRAPQLPTLLRHELMHLQQHDNWYLLAITLVEKLFWWNPLLRVLGSHTRQLQELSCDERCRATNADYPVHLAALMLADLGISRSRAQEPLLLSANMFNKSRTNIQRLKVLQRSHSMKPRHIVSSIATAVFAIVSVGLVTAQPDAQTATAVPADGPNKIFVVRAMSGSDQFVKMETRNDETVVSFSFTDAALPFVLGPLADMLGNPHPVPSPLAGIPGERIDIRRLDVEPQVGVRSIEDGDVMFTAPVAVTRALRVNPENGEVIEATAGEPVQLAFAHVAGAASTEFPISPNLILEADNARERQVTVSGENMSLQDAIAAIATAANCNVFRNDKTIVVDWCGAQ